MGLGDRRIIIFKGPTIIETGTGGGTTEYADVRTDYALVKPINSTRKDIDNTTRLDNLFSFSEIRQDPSFIPTKDMLINYNGTDMVISSITLNEFTPPFYYTIIAGYNGQ